MIDLEPYLDAAMSSLKTHLPVRIAAMNLAKPDLVVPIPANPGGYLLGGRPTIYVPYPTVEIAGSDWELTNPSIGQFSWELAPQMVIRATLEEPDPDILYRKIMRFADCIAEVLTAEGAFGSSGGIRPVTETIRGSYRISGDLSGDINTVGYTTMQFSLGTVAHTP